MANTASAKKAVRVQARKTAVNKSRRTMVKSAIRRVDDAVASGDKAAAQAAVKLAEPAMMRAVSNGVYHKNTGSRKISRLNKAVKAMK